MVFFSLILFLLVGVFNYYTDPYGLKSYENKYIMDININTDARINLKLNSRADFFMIGTSRLMRIDPKIIEGYLKQRVYNIGIFAASYKENLLLASAVKEKGKNFIFGFDAFTLNISAHKNKHYDNRLKNLEEGLSINPYKQYFTIKYLTDSLRFWVKTIGHKDRYGFYKRENSASYRNSLEDVYKKKGFSNKKDLKGPFTNYQIYSDNDIIKLAKLADKKDVIIIYPQHFFYYILFHQHQNIQEQYLHALKVLVDNTEAKVWSFYQINDITRNFNNFDEYGWHFKPTIANQIFSRIFDDKDIVVPDNFGKLLTKDNIDEYLARLREEIETSKNIY